MNFLLAKLCKIMARGVLSSCFWHGIDLEMENDNCFMGNILIIRAAWKIFTSCVKLFLLKFFIFAQGLFANSILYKNSFCVGTIFHILYSKIIVCFSPGRNIESLYVNWRQKSINTKSYHSYFIFDQLRSLNIEANLGHSGKFFSSL